MELNNKTYIEEPGSGLQTDIVKLLREARRPLDVTTIAYVLGRSPRDVCMTLTSLERWREVSKATSRKVQFWRPNP